MHTIMDNGLVEVTESEYDSVKVHFIRYLERYSKHVTGRDEIWFDKYNNQVIGAATNYHSRFFVIDDLYTALVSFNTGK